MTNKNNLKCGIMWLLLIVLSSSITACASVKQQYVKLDADTPLPGKVYNLINVSTGNTDPQLYRQLTSFMSNYFDTNEIAMGYYTISFMDKPGDFSSDGIGWLVFSSSLCFIPTLLGFPLSGNETDLYVYLSIYNSQGNLIEYYQGFNYITYYTGMYYPSPSRWVSKKAGPVYSDLLRGILSKASRDAASINEKLAAAGPITPENTEAARIKIIGK